MLFPLPAGIDCLGGRLQLRVTLYAVGQTVGAPWWATHPGSDVPGGASTKLLQKNSQADHVPGGEGLI